MRAAVENVDKCLPQPRRKNCDGLFGFLIIAIWCSLSYSFWDYEGFVLLKHIGFDDSRITVSPT